MLTEETSRGAQIRSAGLQQQLQTTRQRQQQPPPQSKHELVSDTDGTDNNNPIPPPKATIAYAVSLTSCGKTSTSTSGTGGHSSDSSFHEGAAVLAHSIHLSSIQNYHISQSVFDYHLVAFVHPEAESCCHIFRELGYEVMIRETPFNVTDIKMPFLKEHIVKSGCCGEKEYLKLYAYSLLEFPVVVHLDCK